MSKFEFKLKEALKEEAAQVPDYWENISKKANIPYNGRITMKESPKRNLLRLRYVIPVVCGLAFVVMLSLISFPNNNKVENLFINNIVGSMGSKIGLPENGTTQTVSYETYLEKANMNLDLWLPTGLENTEDAYVYYNEDGTIFMMSGYTFSNPSSGESLTIRFQNDTLPLTDTRYQLENEEITIINGEGIVIGYYKELDAYYTAFMYKGIGYDLTGMQGISQEDFINVIQSIIQ